MIYISLIFGRECGFKQQSIAIYKYIFDLHIRTFTKKHKTIVISFEKPVIPLLSTGRQSAVCWKISPAHTLRMVTAVESGRRRRFGGLTL